VQLQQPKDQVIPDTSETIYISGMALIKMLKHGRAGVPMEVMGLMLGEFVDKYTINVVDVFAMPQSGTGVSVEAVDPVFQTQMLELLSKIDRPEMVVGWYHSHPVFGCWLSGVDVETQASFEQLNERCVAVVVDPLQSVKGKVIIDAFRNISDTTLPTREPRETTCNVGHLHKSSGMAYANGLNRVYYSLRVEYRVSDLQKKILMSLNKSDWLDSLKIESPELFAKRNEHSLDRILEAATEFDKELEAKRKEADEEVSEKEKAKKAKIGVRDPRKRLLEAADNMVQENMARNLVTDVQLTWFKK